jgi:uncharacterized protein (TIGR03437 family)
MLTIRDASRIFVIGAWAAAFLPPLSLAQERRSIENQIPKPVADRTARALGRYPGATRMGVAIGLPLRDKEGLRAFIDALYDPASSGYKRYLTPDQFTARFGASAADYQKVVDFANSSGLTVTATTPNRMIVDVSGSVADFERVFQFTMRTYRHPSESREFHAPDVAPSVPADVPILDIMGLDDYMPPRRMDAKPLASGKVHSDSVTGSGPGGSFQPKDLRAAYLPGVALNGAGQSIGLYEVGPYSPNDVIAFEEAAGLPNVPVVNILLNGVDGIWTPGYDDGEEALDVEMAMALSPGLSQVLVYEGTVPADVLNRMATDNAAKQLSCSWGVGNPSTLQQILMEYAAQGQSFFHSSGDDGGWTIPTDAPDAGPYTTEVGGTTLVTSGPGGAWVSETAWKYSGGGFDSSFPIPSWQATVNMTTNLGSTTYRNIPDIALIASDIFCFIDGHTDSGAGTSFSAPLWAGIVALANQQAAALQNPPVGFLNPALYALGQGSRYNSDFHDIVAGNNTNTASPDLYYAVPGYDLTTGWGTAAGQNLINDLAGGSSGSPGFSLSVVPDQVTVAPGGSASAGVTVTPYGGLTGAVNLAISGLPGGVTASFSPQSATSTSTLSLTVPSSVPVGSYVGKITAYSGSLTQTIAVSLTVAAPVTPDFALSAAPSILSVLPGASVKSVIAIASIGSFSSAAALSVSGTPQGVAASFSPASTSTSSTLTLSAGSQVAPGIYIITIAAASGALNHASTIGLLVRANALSPVPVDLSAIYNVTGIAADGTPFLAGIGGLFAYSANLLGSSLTLGQIPFLFGPTTNGIAPPWNAIADGSGAMTVQLPSGQFGSIQMLGSGQANHEAQQFQVDYADGTSAKFTQSVSNWTSPQDYPGETTALPSMPYLDRNTGAKDATTAYVYNYAFDFDNCKTATSFTLPQNGGLQTLALTLVPSSAPCIASVNVVSGAAGTVSQNAWIEIHGSNLAPPSVPSGGMTWSDAASFAQGEMPTQLNGVGVTVNGKPAYVCYISSGQIDALTPLSASVGTDIPVVVANGTAVSPAFNVNEAALSPALALSGGSKYLAATHGNGTYVGPTTEGAGFTPAAPGEEIVLYGFGFGLPSGGSLVAGSSTQSGTLPIRPSMQIGGQAAEVVFAGLVSPGLYQFNVVVPPTVSSGDNAVTAVYDKVAIGTAGFIPVQGAN